MSTAQVPPTPAPVTLTDQDFAKLKALTEKVIGIFGDDWHLFYDKDETEVECRTDYTGARPFPGAYIPLFLTTQWPDHDPTSPLAEFLSVSAKVVPALIAEVERLRSLVPSAALSVSSGEADTND